MKPTELIEDAGFIIPEEYKLYESDLPWLQATLHFVSRRRSTYPDRYAWLKQAIRIEKTRRLVDVEHKKEREAAEIGLVVRPPVFARYPSIAEKLKKEQHFRTIQKQYNSK